MSGAFAECSSLPPLPREKRVWEIFQRKFPKGFCLFFFSVFAVKIEEASSFLSCFRRFFSSRRIFISWALRSLAWAFSASGGFHTTRKMVCFSLGGRVVGIRGKGEEPYLLFSFLQVSQSSQALGLAFCQLQPLWPCPAPPPHRQCRRFPGGLFPPPEPAPACQVLVELLGASNFRGATFLHERFDARLPSTSARPCNFRWMLLVLDMGPGGVGKQQ